MTQHLVDQTNNSFQSNMGEHFHSQLIWIGIQIYNISSCFRKTCRLILYGREMFQRDNLPASASKEVAQPPDVEDLDKIVPCLARRSAQHSDQIGRVAMLIPKENLFCLHLKFSLPNNTNTLRIEGSL